MTKENAKSNEREKDKEKEKEQDSKKEESSETVRGQTRAMSQTLGDLKINLERIQKDLKKLDEKDQKNNEEISDDKKDAPEKAELNQKIVELEKQIKEVENELKILQDPKNPNAHSPQHQAKIEETQDKLFSLTQDKAKSYLQKVDDEGRLVNNEDGSQTIKCYNDDQYNEGYSELTSSYDRLGLKYEISEDLTTTTITVLLPEKFLGKEPLDLTPNELREVHEAYKMHNEESKDNERDNMEKNRKEHEGGGNLEHDDEDDEYAAKKREEEDKKKRKKREEKEETRNQTEHAKSEAANDRAKAEAKSELAKNKAATAPSMSWASYVHNPQRQTQSAIPPNCLPEHKPGHKPH